MKEDQPSQKLYEKDIMANPKTGAHGYLTTHFANRSREQQSQGWSELWESGQTDFWDRGKPSPALIDFIESATLPRRDGRRLRVLVPGCGKGYDVAMLALHGFDVCGLEVSERGAEVAREFTTSQLSNPSELNFGSKYTHSMTGCVQIIAGDFFKRDWEKLCFEGDTTGFDIIYDYTFLCALLPVMRKDWAHRMSELLAPDGILVCLEFPLYKDLNDIGPPWGLSGVHWNILARGEDGIISEPGEQGEPLNGKFKRTSYFKPPRSYESGRGTDMVSVWMLKK
ncbi:S-adenosyl-L-methionine-dependent methyltransferase [Annulohypoxylon maeteangense]|uniref:S-adenosyl-L-methionine-dependent methyltransferase n=1 Tax=Annulohypoxylon maeteangense TaxID=1927788 RepID=UPI0020088460|nr:S-adenosyl-L-methionine-dependent methyltransferase [Annulohypoxylon maeteangense]KAI0883452.1 S-adenosyl-L-methionine-dependent methyltransferase [Annulohypoxylon maeteangense]